MKRILLILLSVFIFTSCGILKKSTIKNKEQYKTEKKSESEVNKIDSVKVITNIQNKVEKDSLHQNIYEEADSVKVKIIEEITKDKTTIIKDITVYRPVKNTTTNSKSETKENTVIVDSTKVNLVDSTGVSNEKTSSVNTQENKKEFSWSVPWYVYLGGGIVIVIILFYYIRKWVSGKSLKDMLKKLLG